MSGRRPANRTKLRLIAAVLFLGVLAGAAGSPAASRRPRPVARQADAISFSHAVVVDEQRPGFEPDVKIDRNGVLYTSVPFGFVTTQSFVWASHDHGNSYQFVPGIIGPGKPATCVGGGDSDLFLDAANALYFSDLQGLTNISNSMSTDGGATWSTNCAGAPNTPDDRMWFAGTGTSAAHNLVLYQDYDVAAGSAQNQGNALVETVSTDGTHFSPVINSNPGSDCVGIAVHDCVTGNEGISGNQVVDPATGNVYIAHTTVNGSATGGTPGVQVSEGKITSGSATWTESRNLDASLCPDPTCVDSSGNPEEVAGDDFATIARDSAGYLYVTFSAAPLDHNSNDSNFGAPTAPDEIYVVHSLAPAGADPTKLTFSAPQKITGAGASAGTNTFPWITAGSDGRVDVAYYHADETSEPGTCTSGSGTCTMFGPQSLNKAEWSVQLAQSLGAHDTGAAYSTADVSEAPVKNGAICTNGFSCPPPDRSLGDFLQVDVDKQGAAVVSYVFDTSADNSGGQNAGPEVISRQISGPSLFASLGSVSQGAGPGVPMGSVADPSGDAFFSSGGTRSPGGNNLDLTGATLANGANHTLIAKIDVKSLQSLSADSSIGGPDASWMIRWTMIRPGTNGNGDIYYAGMDNNAGTGGSGSTSFFVGDTAGFPPPNPGQPTVYITYPQTTLLNSSQASYSAKTGVITMHIPLADVGNPAPGTRLYSVTAFSATAGSPQSSNTLFNLIDSTPPFDLVTGAPGTVGAPPNGAKPGSTGCPKATGRLAGLGLGRLRLGMTRARARRLLPRFSTRGRRYTDFFCLAPIGLRASYAAPGMLRHLSRAQRRRLSGRIVLLLTADRHYALRGVRPGTRLKVAARRLRLSRRIRIGANDWYVAANGSSHGILKVGHGVVREVGIAVKQLTGNYPGARRFLRALI